MKSIHPYLRLMDAFGVSIRDLANEMGTSYTYPHKILMYKYRCTETQKAKIEDAIRKLVNDKRHQQAEIMREEIIKL